MTPEVNPRNTARSAIVPVRDPATTIEIAGLVRRPRRLEPGALRALPRVVVREAVGSGDTVLEWSGAALRDVVALCDPTPDARFVLIGSGKFTSVARLDDDAATILCDRLDGQPLSQELGGPWRLFVSGSSYFTSVKWIDRLVLTAEEPATTAADVARARIAARKANPGLAEVSCSCIEILGD